MQFTDLKVWQRSHGLVLAVYRLTKGYPQDERFGLISQLRRAAVSVAANIVEGTKRRSPQDYARFLNIAEGSLAEAEYLLILSRDLGYVSKEELKSPLNEAREVASMLHGLRTKVETDS